MKLFFSIYYIKFLILVYYHETALHPMVCAFGIFLHSQVLNSVLQVKMEIDPSELPQASMRPYWYGAQAMEFTEESWLLYSYLKIKKFNFKN